MSDIIVSRERNSDLSNQPLKSLADQLNPDQGQERYHKIILLSARVRARLDAVKACKAEQVRHQASKLDHIPPLPVKDKSKDTIHTLNDLFIQNLVSKRDNVEVSMKEYLPNAVANKHRRAKPLPKLTLLTAQLFSNQVSSLTPAKIEPSQSSSMLQSDSPLNDLGLYEDNNLRYLRNDSAIDLYMDQKELPLLPLSIGLDAATANSKQSNEAPERHEDTDNSPPTTPHKQNQDAQDEPVCFLLLTPPDSPQHRKRNGPEDSMDSFCYAFGAMDRFAEPRVSIKNVQKRINGFFGMLTRTFQLNDIILSRTLVYPSGLFNATDTTLKQPKAVLKVDITENRDRYEQKPDFGFSFFWRGHSTIKPSKAKDSARFALVPDTLVKAALTHWIGKQKSLPPLAQATHIFREKLKLYIVYDRHLINRGKYVLHP